MPYQCWNSNSHSRELENQHKCEDPESCRLEELSESLGYFQSTLSPKYYDRYDRELFLETLRDWGWTGPGAMRPAWL
jgi:hypothetical protein